MRDPERRPLALCARESVTEAEDEGSCEHPRNPRYYVRDEQAHPVVMHAFGAHHKHGLRPVEQSQPQPHGQDPVPSRQLETAARVHIANRTPALGRMVKIAVKCGFCAAGGMVSGTDYRQNATYDQQSHSAHPRTDCAVCVSRSAEVGAAPGCCQPPRVHQ